MGPVVVGSDEAADRLVEGWQVQGRRWCSAACCEVAGQGGEEFRVDGAVEPFDLSAALRAGDGGVNQPDVQLDGGPFEVVTREVGAMIDVQDVGDAAHSPARVGFAPDRLTQSERGLHR